MAGSVIWTVNLKLLLKYQKKELSYLQIPEMKQFSSNLPDSRYIFHGSVFNHDDLVGNPVNELPKWTG